MPETIKKRGCRRTIGGVFSNRKNANTAVRALRAFGVLEQNIELTVTLFDTTRKGKILVAVHHVKKPGPIIEIFDDHQAEYNLDGSRNFRHDVAGLTVGAMAGAAAGGAAGTFAAGPAGAAVGAATGALVGGSVGAAAGKVAEDHK